MEQLMNEMDRMMAQMRWGAWNHRHPALTEGSDTETDTEFESEPACARSLAPWQGSRLPMSVDPTEDGYRVVADLPGFEKDELDLSFDENGRVLRISGTHDEHDEASTHSRRIHEQTSIPGEATVLVEEISATYHNGVLEVHLPTEASPDEDDRTHRIDID